MQKSQREPSWQGRSPVAKAKHLLLPVLDALQEGANVVHAADALQHAQHRLVGASMQRPVKSSHSTCAAVLLHSTLCMRSATSLAIPVGCPCSAPAAPAQIVDLAMSTMAVSTCTTALLAPCWRLAAAVHEKPTRNMQESFLRQDNQQGLHTREKGGAVHSKKVRGILEGGAPAMAV